MLARIRHKDIQTENTIITSGVECLNFLFNKSSSFKVEEENCNFEHDRKICKQTSKSGCDDNDNTGENLFVYIPTVLSASALSPSLL